MGGILNTQNKYEYYGAEIASISFKLMVLIKVRLECIYFNSLQAQ